MAITGSIYSLAKKETDLTSKQVLENMMSTSRDTGAVVIDGRSLAAGTIFAEQIHADAITADKIKAGEIETEHMVAGSIDVDRLKANQLILPGETYGGVKINSEGMSMKSSGLNVTLSSSSGFNITDKGGNQLIDIDPLTGNVIMQINEMKIGGHNAATQDDVEERVRGIELTPGPTGPEGKGVSTVVREFQNSSSGTTIPTGNWSKTPNPVKGQYMWERVTTNYTKGTPDVSHSVTYSAKDGSPGAPGTPGTPGAPGTPGEAGVGVSGDKIEYARSTSGTAIPTSGWGSSIPSVPEGQFLWTRTTITYTNNEKTETYTSAKQGEKGEPGADAISGVLTNESITFAANSSGTVAAQNYVGNTGNFLLMEGAINRSSSTSTTYSRVSQTNVNATISSDGAYTISSMTNGTSVTTGQVTFRATYKGTTIDKTISISKSIAGATGQPGSPGAPGEPGSPGAPGNPGAPATSYWLTSSSDTVTMKYDGDYDPKVITFYGHSKTGTSNATTYAGRFIIQTSTNGTSYTQAYVSSSNQSSYAFTIPSNVSFVKAKFYQAGGTTYLLDEQTVPVLQSAENLEFGGRNLLVQNTITRGRYLISTGGHTVSAAWFHTDYIPVTGYTKLITSGYTNLGNAPSTVYYDSNKVFVKGINNAGSSRAKDITIDPGIAYIRFSGEIKDLPTLKIEKGNIVTDWTPAPEDVQAEIDSRPTFNDFDRTDKVTINGGNIKAGTISSEKNYSWINLQDGTFSFGNKRLVWDGSEMTVNGKISVNNIDGDIPKSKLAGSVQTEINAGSAAKSTLDSKAKTWDTVTSKSEEYKINFDFTSSSDYIILLTRSNLTGAQNYAIGTLTGRRASGHYAAGKIDVVFNNNTSGSAPTGYFEYIDVHYPDSWSMVTCTYNGVSYVGLRHRPNEFGLWNTDARFVGQIGSSGLMLTPVTTSSVTNLSTFQSVGAVGSSTKTADDKATNAKSKTDNWSWSGGVEIDGGKIRAETIKSNQIAAGSITADKIVMGTGTPSSGNLASGRTFSGNYSGAVPGNGNNTVGTTYASFGAGGSNKNNQAESDYIQVDLGSAQQIAESRIFWYAADRRRYYYKIKYSTNGSTWFYAVGNSANNAWTVSKHPSSGSTGSYEPTIDRFAVPIAARYLRIYGNGNTTNTGNHIYEWELYSKVQTTISGSEIVTGTLSADKITTGTLSDKDKNSWINLTNGEFNFAKGGLVYEKGNLTLNGKLNVTNLDGKLSDSQITSATTWNAKETTTGAQAKANAAEEIATIFARTSAGKLISTDPLFQRGSNGFGVYNNSGNSNVTVTREHVPSGSQPGGNPYRMRIRSTGAASPNWGGFIRINNSRANAEFVIRFTANIPSGRTVNEAKNSIGTGSQTKWLTSRAGTGAWREYAYYYKCGTGGSFSNFGHVHISGGSTPTASAPLTWYVSKYEMIDISDSANPASLDDLRSQDKVAIHGSNITANTISANRININTLSAITANLGTVTAGEIKGTNLNMNLNTGRLSMTGPMHNTTYTNTATIAMGNGVLESTSRHTSYPGNTMYAALEGGSFYASDGTNISNGTQYIDAKYNGIDMKHHGGTVATIGPNSNGQIRIQTSNGYVDIGPRNASRAHIDTDRAEFYFNKRVWVAGQLQIGAQNTTFTRQGDTSLNLQTAHGYIGIGPKNTSYAHIYTDRPTFYFNKDLRVNNNLVYHAGRKPTAADVGVTTSSGTNGNGRWVRFYDGTQICWIESLGVGTFENTNVLYGNWTFPVAFLADTGQQNGRPTMLVTKNEYTGATVLRRSSEGGRVNADGKSGRAYVMSDGGGISSGMNQNVRVMVIGRWK